MPTATPPARRSRTRWPWWLLAATPWAWFLVRDHLGVVSLGVAILLPVLVLGTVVVLVALARPRRVGLAVAASVVLAGAVAVALPWTPRDAGPTSPAGAVRVAGANVQNRAGTAAAMLAVDADVLVVAEMTPRLRPALDARYPYRLGGGEGAVAVFSRLPLGTPRTDGLPGLRVEVTGPAGPFALYALHVPRAWYPVDPTGYEVSPDEHLRVVERVADRVAAEPVPTVVVGDLNSADRAPDYRTIVGRAGLVDAMRASGWTGPTSVGKWRPLLVRIDHVLVSTGWCGDDARRFTLPGADHAGVTATVGPCG